jgi:hypothetical protein
MNTFDLRPLSLGEILDRTFTLFRSYFVLFVGISAIPRVLLLVLNLAQVFVLIPMGVGLGGATPKTPAPTAGVVGGLVAYGILAILALVVGIVVVLLTQGATIVAVSELYLGRSITIADSFRRVRGELGTLLGVVILNGLAILAGFIFLIIPGIYIMCRLLVCVPAALSENLGPTESLERSFSLTKDNAGRAFVILLLYGALSIGAGILFAAPFETGVFLSKSSPGMMLFWLAMTQVGAFAAGVLVTPVLTIASAVFYYDLRVRKEAFDLQLLMSPQGIVPAGGGVPRVFS